MNEKITFPRLASLLADRSGRSKRFSEDFLREFFALISEKLEGGESVKVKGLGTFRLSRVEPRRSVDVSTGQPMEISGHSKVVFIPAKELAESVNAPFEAFTAIEIGDDVDISQLQSEDEIALKQESDDTVEEVSSTSYEQIIPPTSIDYFPETNVNKDNAINAEIVDKTPREVEEEANISVTKEDARVVKTEEAELTEGTDEKDPIIASDKKEEPTEASESEERTALEDDTEASDAEADMEEDDELEEVSRKSRNWLKIMTISFGAAMVALIATLAVLYIFAADNFNMVFHKPLAYISQSSTSKGKTGTTGKEIPAVVSDTANETSAVAVDTLSSSDESDVPTAPSDAIVYDTIGTTRYLTTMAKSHYGNYNLWPYIYEENKSFLGHPDRIRPGTPVVIPKLSKYGVDPNNKEDIEKAKKLGMEIYALYGKKI